ncbi:MAG: ferritin-like domain-containing protein [Gemmatimonadetes bacterium]|nr:ferritin-like domain-containing protein [Gemmatimonadota bacterium]MYC73148.1 ferritin-like domain-containing protein [Gemmatimonadota bacterium]
MRYIDGMEIRQFAEQVLFGTRWEDKLVVLDRYEDRAPGAGIATPSAPGRPSGLGLDEWHHREKLRFRDVRHFHSEKERGLVLHFFANHELLALELMALALLKFPQAPEKFRRGLVQTLKDEQEHVRLYQRRMQEIGVQFGEIPVGDFFWKAIGPMETPMDFVTGLSLTLEQANLDYARHYAEVYRQLADLETAAILERIYRDEIGHVKHGLTWFRRWQEAELSEWDAYRQALRFPLGPARAKGIGFNRAGRLQAGLSADYIDELELFSQSRGRCPAVYWFNANCEEQVALGRPGLTPSQRVAELEDDFQALPMLLCVRDDVVLLREKPSPTFLRRMQGLGFAIPEFVECSADGLVALAERKVNALRPWGWSPDSAELFAPLVEGLPRGGEGPCWNEAVRSLYAKSWGAAWLGEFLAAQEADYFCGTDVVGTACETTEQVLTEIGRLGEEGFDAVVIKAIYGSSGRGQIHCRGGQLRAEQRGRLENILRQQGQVVVEPWLDKVVDLSLHFDVGTEGAVTVAGWTRFFTDGRGQYRGSFVGSLTAGLDEEVKRFLYGDGRDARRLPKLGEQLAEWLAEPLCAAGYQGPVGVDAMVCRDRDRLRLKPIVEVNPRTTMGRVALKLQQAVNSARTALWLVISRREVTAAGFADLAECAAALEAAHPARMMPDGKQLSGGVLFTTDPAQARSFATVLLVGESLAECEGYLREVGLELAR